MGKMSYYDKKYFKTLRELSVGFITIVVTCNIARKCFEIIVRKEHKRKSATKCKSTQKCTQA